MKLTTMEESNARKKRQTKDELYQKQREWRREKADQINLKFAKSHHVRELLDVRCKDISINAYILQAILEKLERDGINIHMFDD